MKAKQLAIEMKAKQLAIEIFKEMDKTGCIATDEQKRADICFLPRQKARADKCKGCLYWKN